MLENGYSARSFCTAKLTDEELTELVHFVEPMFTWFAPGSTPEIMRARLCQHSDVVVKVVFFNNEPCAFGIHFCQNFQNQKILYRGGTVVAADHRSHGLYKYLIESSILDEQPEVIVTRTQNPRVYETLLTHTTLLFPTIDNTSVPEAIHEIALEFAHSDEVEPNLCVRGVYTDLRKEKSFRFAKDESLNSFFSDNLGEIDAFILVGFL